MHGGACSGPRRRRHAHGAAEGYQGGSLSAQRGSEVAGRRRRGAGEALGDRLLTCGEAARRTGPPRPRPQAASRHLHERRSLCSGGEWKRRAMRPVDGRSRQWTGTRAAAWRGVYVRAGRQRGRRGACMQAERASRSPSTSRMPCGPGRGGRHGEVPCVECRGSVCLEFQRRSCGRGDDEAG